MSHKTQLVVIGAGPGGYAAAFYASDLGMEVTLVERFTNLGGVCLNVGCIPSKALLHLAALKEEVNAIKEHGLIFGDPQIDLKKMRDFKKAVIKKMTGGLDQLSKARKVKVITGLAEFKDAHHLIVKTKDKKEEIEFQHCILATGSRPIVPPTFDIGSNKVIDSTGALELEDIPEKLLVVGGGVIGLELGSVYASFGSQVTIIEASPMIAGEADRDLIRPLENRLKKSFKDILVETKVDSLVPKNQKIEATYSSKGKKQKAIFDKVLLCIGRRPNSDKLAVEKAGLKVNDRGFISVDNQLRTNIPHIFAIGDLVGNPMLAHKASREAHIAVDVIDGKKEVFDNRGIPSVIYTDPEVAWVGLTETEAKKSDIHYNLAKFPWAASGRATSIARSEGLTKILFEPKTERVLGVGIVGVNAGELIAEGGLALEMGAVMQDLAGTIHAHPTLSESMFEASEALHGMCTHLYSPKKNHREGKG